MGARRSAILCAFVFAVVLAGSAFAQDVAVENTESFTHPKLELTFVAGAVQVPGDGFWLVDEPATGPLRNVQFMPESPGYLHRQGRRTHAEEFRRAVDTGRRSMINAYWALKEWTPERQGAYARDIAEFRAREQKAKLALEKAREAGEKDLGELTRAVERAASNVRSVEQRLEFSRKRAATVGKQLEASPWEEDRRAKTPGPFYLLIPGVGVKSAAGEKREPMILELRPYVDDGKHWVMYNDGRSERVDIDGKLLEKHNAKVSPLKPASATEADKPGENTVYHVVAVLRGTPAVAKLVVRDPVKRRTLTLTWDVRNAKPGQDAACQRWAMARALMRWQPLIDSDGPLILHAWASRMKDVYGVAMPEQPDTRRRRRGNATSLFSVLGGRAAVRETLQMQQLVAPKKDDAAPDVPLADVPGVEVKSHPFGEMLAGAEGGRLEIADVCPLDRFFCYVARPEVSLDYLDSSGDFLSRLGGTATEQRIVYNLKERYLSRLGLTEEWCRRLLKTGAVKDLAVVAPDLFFIDGTDVTLVIRLSRPLLVRPLLMLMKLGGLGDEITAVARVGGDAYWAASGPYLVIGTRRSEVEKVLALRKAEGAGSLGKSDEFRYMLTKLPLGEQSVGCVYFSDPFIRRLVGPACKIGQLRRLRARANMELLTSGALLCKADGVEGATDIDRLVELGYVPASVKDNDIALGEDFVARSKRHGTLAETVPLLGNPVEAVSQEEAKAYGRYRDNYTRFWRQFFDPIAIRLDKTGERDFEVTTFILPLINSSVYNAVRRGIAVSPKPPLRVPVLAEAPIMMLSVNVAERAWQEFVRDAMRDLTSRAQLAVGLLDLLGPSVHLALLDSDAIIQFGSGDMLGAFGMDGMRLNDDFIGILMVAMVLTRPSRVAIELNDPEAARQLLRLSALRWQAPKRRRWGFGDMNIRLSETAVKDRWLLAVDLMGMIHLRFGVEVQEGFLVLSNMPWGGRARVTKVADAPLNGVALALHPEALDAALPGIHEAAMRKQGTAALRGMGCLYPMLVAGASNSDSATTLHRLLFGFVPLHPGEGKWVWENGRIASTTFGTPTAPIQPAFEPGKPFGLLQGVADLSLNMQLEEGGLRAVCTWSRP